LTILTKNKIILVMRNTTTRTFSINDEIYKEFIKIIKDKNINKSKLIEKFIIEFVNDNK